MKQTAQVIRPLRPGYVEVKIRRASACASAHNCGSCDHCSFMENAPEILVEAENICGARPGDTVTVESATGKVLGAAAVLYLVPLALFFLGYFLGSGMGWSESTAIVLGGIGFGAGLLIALMLDRYRKKCTLSVRVIAVEN